MALPAAVLCSRRLIFETWAKVVSILLCIFGLGWTAIAFILVRLKDSGSGPIEVGLGLTRTFIAGICIGLILAFLIARPYKRVTLEK